MTKMCNLFYLDFVEYHDIKCEILTMFSSIIWILSWKQFIIYWWWAWRRH